jgi:hypothetical protein
MLALRLPEDLEARLVAPKAFMRAKPLANISLTWKIVSWRKNAMRKLYLAKTPLFP